MLKQYNNDTKLISGYVTEYFIVLLTQRNSPEKRFSYMYSYDHPFCFDSFP